MWIVLSNFLLCIYSCDPHSQNTELCHHHKKPACTALPKTCTHLPQHCPCPLVIANLFSISTVLSYQVYYVNASLQYVSFWDWTVFNKNNAPELHSVCYVYYKLVPSYCWVAFHCTDVPEVAKPFIYWGIFGMYPVLSY